MAYIFVFLLFITLINAEADPISKTYLPSSRYYSGYSSYPTANGRTKDDSYRYPGLTSTSYTNKYHSSKYPFSDSTSGREIWNPSSSWNGTYSRYQNQYIRPNYYPDSVEGSYSMYQYQHIRSPIAYKKTSPYYSKFVKAPEKPKQKPQIAYYPMGYKKTNYPRVHNPYTMHKYPTKKTPHPYYRRYYQNYAIPSPDMFRNRVKNIYAETESSTSATTATTTEDRNDYSMTSEDYTNYNGTYPSPSNGYPAYYDNYEEQTTAEPSAVSYDETSTRGYYGDRIYMSSHVAPQNSDNGFRHRIYVARNESEEDEDSDETIFD